MQATGVIEACTQPIRLVGAAPSAEVDEVAGKAAAPVECGCCTCRAAAVLAAQAPPLLCRAPLPPEEGSTVTEEAGQSTAAGEAGSTPGEREEAAAASAQAGEGSSSVLPILGAVARRPISAASARKLHAGALRALQEVAPLRASAAAFLALLQRCGGLRLGQAPVLPSASDAAGAAHRLLYTVRAC